MTARRRHLAVSASRLSPQRSRWRARVATLCALALAGTSLCVVGAVTLTVRIDEGQWRVPAKADFLRIARRFEPTS